MLVCVAGRGEKEKKERMRDEVKDDKRRNGDIQIFVLLFIVGDVNGALYGLSPFLTPLYSSGRSFHHFLFLFFPYFTFSYKKK